MGNKSLFIKLFFERFYFQQLENLAKKRRKNNQAKQHHEDLLKQKSIMQDRKGRCILYGDREETIYHI